ncbi:MAG: hypothetical protein M3527_07430 [Actinomycetota bacterium]|nr:hypothetical protein [Acidimicrobiia bacterium]MDQ3294264.1 hypothetical protein [Actinomycetota bacterium]
MPKGQLTIAARIRPGDCVVTDGRLARVSRVKRAQGRKPAVGENLHVVSDGEVLRMNSTDPVRVVRDQA